MKKEHELKFATLAERLARLQFLDLFVVSPPAQFWQRLSSTGIKELRVAAPTTEEDVAAFLVAIEKQQQLQMIEVDCQGAFSELYGQHHKVFSDILERGKSLRYLVFYRARRSNESLLASLSRSRVQKVKRLA